MTEIVVHTPPFARSLKAMPPREMPVLTKREEDIVFWFTKASWPFWSLTVFSMVMLFVFKP